MSWTSLLPSSPESLSRIEGFIWIFAGCSIVLSVLLGFAARSVGQHKTLIIQKQSAKALDERDAKIKKLQNIVEETKNQVAADHSLKNRFRSLFALIDPQILRVIDAGQTDLTIRMQPGDFEALEKLLTEPSGEKLVTIKGRGRKMVNSMISNGTLGPQGAVPLQEEIMVGVSSAMKGTD